MSVFRQSLAEAAGQFGLDLTDDQMDRFDRYNALLLDWNRRVNLTALSEPRDVAVKHMLDSLSVIRAVVMPLGATVIDVGTGAGFPGLPLKILRDDLRLTLLDSLGKRVEFLKAAVRELELNGVDVVQGRAEDVAHDPGHRERYDLATARSVAPLNVLLEYLLPFVRVGGSAVALKGPGCAAELAEAKAALDVLGGGDVAFTELHLPLINDGQRAIICIAKSAATPAKYPRRPGLPKKKPIAVRSQE